ncbi:MAG TPA: S8/S53 family peptidase [Thermoanaerobaculia bacterium]|nr:S8/S53 family peptidase [Thermoanaerobaculia bacterium]
MKKSCLFWIASSLAVGMSACTTLQPPRPAMAGACANWRWIGISQPEARCPDVPGWTVRPLFPQLAPVRQTSGEYCAKEYDENENSPRPELIRELNRFCVYEVAGWKERLGHYSFPPAASAELVRLDQDCAALSLSEKYLPTKTWAPDRDLYVAQAGAPKTLRTEDQPGVRLSFLDTQPTGEDFPASQGNSPHGFTLARVAQQLVCPPEPGAHCAAQITTRLALPIIDFDPKSPKHNWTDPEGGGYLGMQSDLAEAIRSEVDSWRKEKLQRHLVLNLSMAWDGELFGGLNEEQVDDLRAGTQAVYRALQYAASFDVLVLAAAGNQKREPCANTGPLLPAAWEREAPREEACPETEKKKKRPLLYAVGGLQSNDQPLGNARRGGMPQRAAYGETGFFSGSSVATAVASSIAAVVWHYFPDHDSHWIMKRLDAGGRGLSFNADFWFGSSAPLTAPSPKVHKLSLCAALEDACAQPGSGPCPIPLPCPRTAEASPVPPGLSGSTPAARGSCQPWNFPQPEDDPCPNCRPPIPP